MQIDEDFHMSSPELDIDIGRVLVPNTQEVFTQIPADRGAQTQADNDSEADAHGSDWTHSPTSHSSRFLRQDEGEPNHNEQL